VATYHTHPKPICGEGGAWDTFSEPDKDTIYFDILRTNDGRILLGKPYVIQTQPRITDSRKWLQKVLRGVPEAWGFGPVPIVPEISGAPYP
jgi:hypothetical protein